MVKDPIKWSSLTSAPQDGAGDDRASEFVDAQMALSAPKRLMAMLRDLMAGAKEPADKLHDIVAMVARELRADTCICYILKAGEVLELFSAVGLPADMLRREKLRVGEGLIGDIAASAFPLVVQDVELLGGDQRLPMADGKNFRALCGVPVLRGGRMRAVLAVQNKMPRAYGDEVVEIMQTVAMVVAELVVSGGLLSREEISSGFAAGGKPTHVDGLSLGRGLAIGTAVLYEPGISMRDIVADDTREQKLRLRKAVTAMHDAIERMLTRNSGVFSSGSESRDILEAYQMFARDRGWLAKIENAIDKGLSAEAAVSAVLNETRARMMQMNDAYLRERLEDMEDLSNRLLSHLLREGRPQSSADLPDNIILVARSLGPAALLDYDHSKLKGVVLEKGSHSNHVAIVARSLGIPVVGQAGDILNFVEGGDQVIVDGDHGQVYVRPSQYLVDLYSKSIETRARRTTLNQAHIHRQSVTKDGIKISVMMNAGLMPDVDAVQTAGADGIGLYRTELSFMGWQKYPLVVMQAEFYGKIMDKMGDKPVTFRTLDIGGDKPLPYFKAPEEENPALGWRAVRIGMDRPAVLRTQFRAFIRGSKGRSLRIMLPFVTEVAEFDRARQFLEMEKDRARAKGIVVPEKIELGVMLEVPALLFQLETLLPSVDFISVGSNDLMQYLYAADRGNTAIRSRYDALSPSMLRVLKVIADQCRAADKPLSICGEMAAHPLEAMVLIALGYQTLSVSAQSIESLKVMIPTLDTRMLLPYIERLMSSREHSLRDRLMSFAKDHNINLSQMV